MVPRMASSVLMGRITAVIANKTLALSILKFWNYSYIFSSLINNFLSRNAVLFR